VKRDFKKRIVSIAGIDPIRLLGVEDRNLRLIEEHFDENVVVRGEEIILAGSPRTVEQLTRVLEKLVEIAGSGRSVTEGDVLGVIRGGKAAGEKVGALDDSIVSSSRSARRGRGRRTSRSPARSPRSREARSNGSSFRGPSSRRGRTSGFCRGTCRRRSSRTCARSSTRSGT
jgi:hypothetical protein